jgi:hypothetical protein
VEARERLVNVNCDAMPLALLYGNRSATLRDSIVDVVRYQLNELSTQQVEKADYDVVQLRAMQIEIGDKAP